MISVTHPPLQVMPSHVELSPSHTGVSGTGVVELEHAHVKSAASLTLVAARKSHIPTFCSGPVEERENNRDQRDSMANRDELWIC